MSEQEGTQIFFAKAEQSLAGAESEFINNRYDNCATRCYYATFQAAISALLRDGIEPRQGRWEHEFVQGQFVGQLVNRRKRYPADLRDVLDRNVVLRRDADYTHQHITQTEAYRALRRTRTFVEAIQKGGDMP